MLFKIPETGLKTQDYHSNAGLLVEYDSHPMDHNDSFCCILIKLICEMIGFD